MSEAELVVAALVAGASAGLGDTASSVVRDAYAGLREAVRSRLAAHDKNGVRILESDEVRSEAWQARLSWQLVASGANRDEEIVAAARVLLQELGEAPPFDSYRPTVDAREARGVQVGDGNTQTNTFN